MRFKCVLLVPVLLLVACQPEANQQAAANQAVSKGEETGDTLPMKEVMAHVFQYNAEGIWTRQGFVSDAKGERSLFPASEREWALAESAGLTLAELSNLLLVEGRRVDDPRWQPAVAELRKISLRAARAAEAKDEDAFFQAGSELDTACENCHLKFAPWAEDQRSESLVDRN